MSAPETNVKRIASETLARYLRLQTKYATAEMGMPIKGISHTV
jgi:hypothetical protein